MIRMTLVRNSESHLGSKGAIAAGWSGDTKKDKRDNAKQRAFKRKCKDRWKFGKWRFSGGYTTSAASQIELLLYAVSIFIVMRGERPNVFCVDRRRPLIAKIGFLGPYRLETRSFSCPGPNGSRNRRAFSMRLVGA